MEGARRMREEASEIRDTLADIESWADKFKMLAEEVQTQQGQVHTWKYFSVTITCSDYLYEDCGEGLEGSWVMDMKVLNVTW